MFIYDIDWNGRRQLNCVKFLLTSMQCNIFIVECLEPNGESMPGAHKMGNMAASNILRHQFPRIQSNEWGIVALLFVLSRYFKLFQAWWFGSLPSWFLVCSWLLRIVATILAIDLVVCYNCCPSVCPFNHSCKHKVLFPFLSPHIFLAWLWPVCDAGFSDGFCSFLGLQIPSLC